MLIKVRVRPNSGTQSVEKVKLPGFSEEEGQIYFVKLKSHPEEGKANLELIKILQKYFGKEVRIKSGFRSRNKLVEIGD